MQERHEIPTDAPVGRALRLPMQAAPIDRTPTAAALNASSGVEASLFGFNLCDFLPSPAKEICHAIGTGIGTE